VGINTLQIAWLSRLADKSIIRRGYSIVEFSPQDVSSPRGAVRKYALRHNPADEVDRMLDRIFEGENPRPDGIPAFYQLFGVERYRSLDLLDSRANWIRDFNEHVTVNEQFDLATNFGTAEHVFNIGHLFHSIHDAVRPGGVMLHVLPTFGDIDHGFYNIHPTLYFDLAEANDYTVEDIFYGDRWDIRNKMLEADLAADFDFDAVPIRAEHMKNRAVLQRMVTEQFVANFNDVNTQRYGASYPGLLYDYCTVALRKNRSRAFRAPIQGFYRGTSVAAAADPNALKGVQLGSRIGEFVTKVVARTREGGLFGAILRRIRRVWKALVT
jgi:SAM-dependent methyltransferase